ncbi:tRNA-splicing endonuclease subunit Sen54-like isoform X2 [Tribolium madens]|uniref:tRNA-splicing endonuclease subunit Sen54-like isoform X2 n=1 Tax=Tribolium madens TaxID=41895 RepID=UPI001CF72D1B|nr:tRNA-splicing endonuclease subunit Sen54-like isoform X2 [Tribolium madens]
MSLKDKVEKYFHDHNNPIVKTESFGTKLFLSSLSEKEEGLKNRCLVGIESVLRHTRVERRVARSVAEWLPDRNMALLTKPTGSSIGGFGVQNKEGKFLSPEESLYLLEANKLELIQDKVPLSIQEAYKKIQLNYAKYQAFKKLVLQGYKVKLLKINQEDTTKRKIESNDEGPATKVAKMNNDQFAPIFEKLREMGPQPFKGQGHHNLPDYTIKSPTSSDCFNLIFEIFLQFQ